MAKIRFILVGLLSLLILINTCSAAVEFTIPQATKYVTPGSTVSYDLDVSLGQNPDLTVPYPITEEFSIDPMREGWSYSFSKDNIELDLSNPTASSIISITVPSNAAPGSYSHTVYATGYDSIGRQYNFATELAYSVINTDVQIPEFPTVALPMVAIIGLVAIIGRRKE
ncbi:MAG: PEF-CTERM sorting domain-containing protein [Methanosarcina mazei]